MIDDKERRAFALLQWVPYSLAADFDPALAIKGHYTCLQKQRSDKALDAWDKANPIQSSPELKAFKTLHDLGHFSDEEYYSPSKAKNGFYTAELKRITLSCSTDETQKPSRRNRYRRTRGRLASFDAECGGAS
jgi:hypothetical protein